MPTNCGGVKKRKEVQTLGPSQTLSTVLDFEDSATERTWLRCKGRLYYFTLFGRPASRRALLARRPVVDLAIQGDGCLRLRPAPYKPGKSVGFRSGSAPSFGPNIGFACKVREEVHHPTIQR